MDGGGGEETKFCYLYIQKRRHFDRQHTCTTRTRTTKKKMMNIQLLDDHHRRIKLHTNDTKRNAHRLTVARRWKIFFLLFVLLLFVLDSFRFYSLFLVSFLFYSLFLVSFRSFTRFDVKNAFTAALNRSHDKWRMIFSLVFI